MRLAHKEITADAFKQVIIQKVSNIHELLNCKGGIHKALLGNLTKPTPGPNAQLVDEV